MKDCCVEEGFINRNGVKLYFIMKGSKKDCPTIVFIHGNDMNTTVWKCQQDYFCRFYNTLAIDLRGFGKSSKPPGPLTAQVHTEDLKAILDKLCIKKVYLVGWSIGGIVSLSFTITYSTYVKKLILVDTAPQILKSPEFPFGRTLEQQAEVLALIEFDFPKYAETGAANSVPETCSGAKLVKNKIEKIILSNDNQIVLRQTIDIDLFSAVSRLPLITIPTLIVFGGKDGVLNPNASTFMRQHISNSKIYEFPEAGHNPFLTYYKEFNKRMAKFLCDKDECQICFIFAAQKSHSVR